MEQNQNYKEDLSEIRNIMEKSSRFISLSGASGIIIGIYAIVGTYFIYRLGYLSESFTYEGDLNTIQSKGFISVGLTVLVLALGSAIALSYKKAKRMNLPLWDHTAKRLIISLLIPLVAGGLFILILLSQGEIKLLAPLTLIFYGLTLVNASKYTYNDLKVLGITEVILGLLGSYFIGYGLVFWTIGFGVAHIVYGVWMYYKYER